MRKTSICLFVFISACISKVAGGWLQKERCTQFKVFEDEPTKPQGEQLWNVTRPTLH
jgi:hypothetical protein